MKLDRLHLIMAFLYAIAGMVLGIIMASTHNHGQHVTHAHILLLGFVVSFIYAASNKLWFSGYAGILGIIQFVIHHLGAITIFIGLFIMYGDSAKAKAVEPYLAGGSITVLVAAILFLVIIFVAQPKKDINSF